MMYGFINFERSLAATRIIPTYRWSLLFKIVLVYFFQVGFRCEMCHSFHDTRQLLDAHHLKMHRGRKKVAKHTRRYKCDICDRWYTHSASLRSHIVNAHDVVPASRIRVTTKGQLSRLSSGSLEKGGKFKCAECGRGLTTKRKLHDHMALIHGWTGEKFNSMFEKK